MARERGVTLRSEQDRAGLGHALAAGRGDQHPPFVLFGLIFVGDQHEAELADVEGDRLVIVAHDQGDMGQRLLQSRLLLGVIAKRGTILCRLPLHAPPLDATPDTFRIIHP